VWLVLYVLCNAGDLELDALVNGKPVVMFEQTSV